MACIRLQVLPRVPIRSTVGVECERALGFKQFKDVNALLFGGENGDKFVYDECASQHEAAIHHLHRQVVTNLGILHVQLLEDGVSVGN